MPAKKKTVSSPLHLLQQLSRSLVEHLEKACADAQKETHGLLAKLEKQRGKTRDKLVRARAKLDEAGAAGKSKAQGKARARIDELDEALALLDVRQRETLAYLADLERDTQQSLKLAEGIRRVEEAAAQAVAAPAKSASAAAPSRSRQRSTPKTTSAQAATKAAGTKPAPAGRAAAAKPRATRSTTSKAKPATAAKPTAAKKPAPRKPATRKPAGATQAPASSS
ncbi:AlgP family protein [Stutzerimonas nitrititolerans]|uniref:AlgP family protein n=1 Tax=Stutzerimonas nitrititolerans TaxID=2482751 RepID=UPI002647B600|nr:AlgP family protein [Stutzerimonas nitrititolerans]